MITRAAISRPQSEARGVKVDVFIDFRCPWCLIGMLKLQRLLAMLEPGVELQLNFLPFLLDVGAAADGVKIHERLRPRCGAEPAAIFAPIESEALAVCCDRQALAGVEAEARTAVARGARSVPTLVLPTGQMFSANAATSVLMDALVGRSG